MLYCSSTPAEAMGVVLWQYTHLPRHLSDVLLQRALVAAQRLQPRFQTRALVPQPAQLRLERTAVLRLALLGLERALCSEGRQERGGRCSTVQGWPVGGTFGSTATLVGKRGALQCRDGPHGRYMWQ